MAREEFTEGEAEAGWRPERAAKRAKRGNSPRAPPRHDVRAISRINASRVLHAPINHIYNTHNIFPSMLRGDAPR